MNFFIILILSQVAAQGTHALALTKHFGSVRASSFLTLVFIGLTTLLHVENALPYQAAFLGSSFVGMTDPTRFSRWQIALSSVVFTFIFFFLVKFLKGPGGVLGFSAFSSCLIVHFMWTFIMHRTLKFRRPE